MIVPLAVLLCVAQAVLTVLTENVWTLSITGTLIPIMTFGVLLALVLAVNPLLRLARGVVRPLARAEVMCLFAAMLVSSGISTLGLSTQLVPLIGSPWNPEWNTPQRGWEHVLLPRLNPSLYLSIPADGTPEQRAEALAAIRQFREGFQPVNEAGVVINRPPDDAPWREQVGYMRHVFGQMPWSRWISPFAYWMIFIAACYMLFYSLTFLLLHHWSRREQLNFPLAQLPMALLPDEQHGSLLPACCRTWGFWVFFALSFFVSNWNSAVDSQLMGGLSRINLGMGREQTAEMLRQTPWEAFTGGQFTLQYLIIFTGIGLAFLLPTATSFSVWSYWWVGKLMVLAAVWMGYGQTGADFPSNARMSGNFVTSQAGGALLLFSAVCLVRALADRIACARGLSPRQRLWIFMPMLGIAVSLLVMIGWLRWNDLPIVVGTIVAVVIVLVTIGLMRIVAETGVWWIQVHVGPFHLFNAFGLGKLVSTTVLAPLLPIYTVMFTDIKASMPPSLMNAAKMQDDLTNGAFRGNPSGGEDSPAEAGSAARSMRVKFHLCLVLGIIASIVTALGVTVFLAYLRGGQRMRNYLWVNQPRGTVDVAYRFMLDTAETMNANAAWYFVGAAWLALTLIIRRRMFWFPHPIGYILLLNPLMSPLWFSFFIGWCCKFIVVRYGGKATFQRVLPMFIGLIVGELLAIVLWIAIHMLVLPEAVVPAISRYRI